MAYSSPIFCALDMADTTKAVRQASMLRGQVHGIKLGLEFFSAQGPKGIQGVGVLSMPIFLDLKLHDIPNTVAGSITSLLPLRPAFITLHASGGPTMLRAAAAAVAKAGTYRPRLLAVTVLTSLDEGDLAAIGQDANTQDQSARLAQLSKECGIDGVVCAPTEVASLRQLCGPDFGLMVPGIRPSWASADDQKRVMTPKEAMDAGASYLVIGRPITTAADPVAAARKINEELKEPSN